MTHRSDAGDRHGGAAGELVVGAMQAATAGDIETFLKALHPEIELYEPDHLPYGGVYRGKEAFAELIGRAAKVLDLQSIDLISVTADESRCVLLMTGRELVTGEQRTITEHWEIESELIRRVRVFWYELPSAAAGDWLSA